MGRSLYFSYTKVESFNGQISEELRSKISNLHIGDCFRMKVIGYPIYNERPDDLSFPLTRTNSTYGGEPIPIDEELDYVVETVNEEPGLYLEKGIQSIRFALNQNSDKYFCIYRILTDGTIREWEGMGIIFVILNIELK